MGTFLPLHLALTPCMCSSEQRITVNRALPACRAACQLASMLHVSLIHPSIWMLAVKAGKLRLFVLHPRSEPPMKAAKSGSDESNALKASDLRRSSVSK